MNIILQLISNHVLIAALSAWLIAQVVKVIVHLCVEHKFSWERFFGDGGMPSLHSAIVAGLSTMCGITAGFDSVEFALALVFSFVVMRDAMGVRREAGKHAVTIKGLADALNKTLFDKDAQIRTDNLKILVGHTPLQVIIGALIGVGVSISYYFIFLV